MEVTKSSSSTYLVSLGLFVGLIFLAGEALVIYGVFSGLIMAMGLVLGFCMIAILARHLDQGINAAINRRFSPLNKILLQMWGGFVMLELLIIEGLSIGHLGAFLFEKPFFLSVSLFYLAGLVATLIQRDWSERVGSFQILKLAVYFPLVILFPIYAFLQKSPENVYHNLLHYSPWFLHLQQDGLGLFLLAIALIGYGKLILILLETHQGLQLNRKKTLRRLGVAVVVWAAGILALSATAIVAISEKIPIDQPSLLVIELAKKIGAPFILMAFCGSLLLIAVSTVVLLMVKLRVSFRTIFGTRSGLTEGFSIFASCLLATAFATWVESRGLSILDFILVLGVLDGPVGVTLTLICLSERLKRGNWSIWGYPVISTIGVFFILNWLHTPHYVVGVLLSSGITLILMFLHIGGSYLFGDQQR